MRYHAGKRDGLRKDGPDMLTGIQMRETLRKRWGAAKWSIPEDFLSFDHYERVVKGLDWTSSPGYPWLFQHTTNSAMFMVKDGVPSREALNRVWKVVSDRIVERDSDPIRLFIKPEPHKEKKLRDKAYRLISSVSVIDQIIDGMLFGEMNQTIIDNYIEVPGKVGWSPYKGGWKLMPIFGNVSLDKSAWDWSVNSWIVQEVLGLRTELCANLSDRWLELATWRYQALYDSPLFVTSGGLLLKQRQPGVIKSGCFNTIIDNSIAQDLLHVRVCVENDFPVGPLASMGDDTTQPDFAERSKYEEKLSEFCHLKSSVKATEFAGHRFRVGFVEPLYKGKHAFNIMHLDPKNGEEMAASYALLYHRSVYRDYIRGVLTRLGYDLPSLKTLDVIFDGD